MVILDTSIFIDHLRRGSRDSALDKIARKHKGDEIAFAMVTLQELYAGKSSKQAEEEMFKAIIDYGILPYEYFTAELAGTLSREYDIRSIDALIAATCIENEATLYTLNLKDFQKIPDLKLGDLDE